jgi:hypothetical protein
MKVIPQAAWALAVALSVVVVGGLLLFQFVIQRRIQPIEEPVRFPTVWTFFLFSIILATFFIYMLILGYIAGDARRRGMRAGLWVLLAFLMPSAIGMLLYFILREPLLHTCPKCGAGAKSSFPYCPSCGASLANVCPSCRSAVEPGWSHCARCGTQLQVAQIP